MSSTESSLILVNMVDGVEAYIVLDKPGYRLGSEAKIHVLLRNHGESKTLNVGVRSERGVFHRENVEIGSREEKIVTITSGVPERIGEHWLELLVNEKTIDRVRYIVEEPSRRKPLYFTIVWHHHQAPNYLPDGRIHSPWAYIYVWGDHLKPYGRGPYHYHAVMLKNHPGFKTTYNLSPSLLFQWEKLLNEGVVYVSGERYSRDSREAALVRETLNIYREAVKRGQIDVLSSIYAHTIGGFLVSVLGMRDVVAEEIEYGLEVTSRVIGDDYRAEGFWTPEMAFSMDLIPIYYDHEVKYTVLDDLHHFSNAEGEKDTAYKPYLAVDPESGKHVTVFFRDHVLSDILGFKNNFNNEFHAWRNAYELSYLILKKWFEPRADVLVLALDGENWMVFSKNPPLTAYYLDKLIIYLETLNDQGYVKLSTLKEIYEALPVNRVLRKIPTNTWLGTFRKWRGEISDHEKYWVRVYGDYRKLKAFEHMFRDDRETSRKIRWCLWHALDSDYWWAEFWKPEAINAWLEIVEKTLEDKLSKVRVKDIRSVSKLVEGVDSKLVIEVENTSEHEAYLALVISSDGVRVQDSVEPLIVKPRSTCLREVRVQPRYCGSYYLNAYIVSNGYVVNCFEKEVFIEPYIPPNPV